MGRKRQRSRAALTEEDDQPESTQDHSEDQEAEDIDVEEEEEEEEEEMAEERQREQEVWDSFKEEHHEVLEQLPLSLHRQFKLMRELDSHSEAFHADLLASVRQYIHLRESLAARSLQDGSSHPEGAISNGENTNASNMTIDEGGDTSDLPPMQVDQDPTPITHPNQRKPSETTRKLLQHIAQTSEEAIRTAEEKVNIAQTAYETVDRHIRLLDQAIKEQEAAISLGVRPGTHLAPILLPDLVVPRWARPPRVEHSPIPSLTPEPELCLEEPPALELPPPPPPKASKKKKKVAPPKPSPKSEKEEDVNVPPEAVGGEESVTGRTRRTGVRLTIPAQTLPPAPEPSVPADPNDERYCYCNQVSFGTMIACDYEGGCRLEWFHFGCTGLVEVPSKKAKWYCRECKAKMTQKGKSRT